MTDTPLRLAAHALDDADAAVERLHAACCEPGRSPSMDKLAATLSAARERLATVATARSEADALMLTLEEAGSQLGRLQVGCCAPARLPLYARVLEDLTQVQLQVNRHLGRAH